MRTHQRHSTDEGRISNDIKELRNEIEEKNVENESIKESLRAINDRLKHRSKEEQEEEEEENERHKFNREKEFKEEFERLNDKISSLRKDNNLNRQTVKSELRSSMKDLIGHLEKEINDVKSNMADKASVELATIAASSSKADHSCHATSIKEHTIFKKGLDAGVYTEIGSKKTLNDCVTACCRDDKCSVAFLVGDKCYTVECYSEGSCLTQEIEKSEYSTKIISIQKSKDGHQLQTENLLLKKLFTEPPGKDVSQRCSEATFIEDTTLSGGLPVGRFKRHGEVSTDDLCIGICCREKG